MKFRYYIFLLLLLVFFSCEKVFMKKDSENSPKENFEYLWQTLDQRYSFFTYKGIDWDGIHDKYAPEVKEDMNDRELFEVLANMLNELRDGHVNLHSGSDVSHYWNWFLDYPSNYEASIVEANYLKDDYHISGPLLNTIIDSIGYIYCGSFSTAIKAGEIDYVIERFKDLKGVIIDVRNNGGGNLEGAMILASRFADTKRHTQDTYFKKGPGHDDFHLPVATYISPAGPQQFLKKVIVLSNRKCYSSTNQFVQTMRVMPHVVIMGDTTGGGGGTPISHELPNGWIFRYSSDMTVAPDGFNLEHGIPPDVVVSLKPADASQGIDTMIEKALDEMN